MSENSEAIEELCSSDPNVQRILDNEQLILALDNEYAKEVRLLELKFIAKKLPIFNNRNKSASLVENYWSMAFLNSPVFESFMNEQERTLFTNHLTDFTVDQGENVKMTWTFSENEHFSNPKIVKEIKVVDGSCIPHAINWKKGGLKLSAEMHHHHDGPCDHPEKKQKTDLVQVEPGFFNWLEESNSNEEFEQWLLSMFYQQSGKYYLGMADEDEDDYDGDDE